MKSSSGFTLVELLAVIAVLGIVITAATTSVLVILDKARKGISKEMQGSLKDVAITYVIDSAHLQKCPIQFSKDVYEKNDISKLSQNSACAQKILVQELIKAGVFEDKKGYCASTDFVVVYRYNDGTSSEYKAYISDNACGNY